MKKIINSFMVLAIMAVLMVVPAAQADTSVNIQYTEINLGGDLWQYDFTIMNTSLADDEYSYLSSVALDFEEGACVTVLSSPDDWSIGSFIGDLPDTTDYVEMYSDAMDYDALFGNRLLLSITADYQLGEIAYEAEFSDHGAFENWTSVTGTASAVPVPGALWLLGTGLMGLVGIRRRNDR